MIDPKIRTLLRDNRQIRLHILFVLWASPGPVTIAEIAADLNVNRDTISDWLPAMESDGYICHFGAGRWNKWSVTDKYRQLPLPNLFSDAEKPRISRSSSSSSLIEEENADQRELLLLRDVMRKKPASELTSEPVRHPAAADLSRWMSETFGTPHAIADAAIDAALSEDMEPIDIKHEALWWWMYWASGDGESINNLGAFIARKIQNGEYVHPGYTYSESKARQKCGHIVDEFLEVEYIYDSREESTP